MINLAAALRKSKLAQNNGSSRSNVERREQNCFLDGNDLILFNILKRLPVECLMKFKLVCRRWRYLITHVKYLVDLHFNYSEARLRNDDENTFLLYPTRGVYRTIEIKKFLFCRKDLKIDDGQGHLLSDTAAVVTSNNVILDGKRISMLEPVQGLVCFVNGNSPSVLIYNLSTQVKTPWIKTLTSAVSRDLVGVKPLKLSMSELMHCFDLELSISNKCMFGFGIDPTTNQHKVLCIHKIVKKREGVTVSPVLVCRVLTVGENTWRKIDQVPPDTVISNNSVHVRGSIYWMSENLSSQNGVMVFDLGSETFRLITIPNFVLHLWTRIDALKLVHELAEVDGHLAILARGRDDMLHVWIYNADKGSSDTDGNWIEETVQLPCCWDQIYKLAFKAITGTSLVIIKISRKEHQTNKFHCEYLQYYHRREKKYYRNQFMILWEPNDVYNATYSITPFFDTLLPVQTPDYSAW
ncbi:hypothetical protein MKX01_014527 [Papaver californicum]|nr:hypothetical protein MKX01_014527 [Papaver californicum]